MADWSVLISVAALGLGLFLGLALWRQPHRPELAGNLLALLAVYLFMLTDDLFFRSRAYQSAPWALAVYGLWLEFLLGPLVWLFALQLAQAPRPRGWRLGLHFLPALLPALSLWYHMLTLSTAELVAVVDANLSDGAQAAQAFDPVGLAILVQGGAYLFAVWRLLGRYRVRLEADHASWSGSSLNLLRDIAASLGLLWLVGALDWGLGPLTSPEFFELALQFTQALLIFCLAYALWQQRPVHFVLEQDKPVAPGNTGPGMEKYARSALDKSSSAMLFEALERLMAEQEAWREPELGLAALAERMGCTPHYLSQAINESVGVNFFAYVNGYRIEAIKKALAEPGPGNVLDLALAAGFNSKSAFYSTFKESVGMTPRAYQKRLNST